MNDEIDTNMLIEALQLELGAMQDALFLHFGVKEEKLDEALDAYLELSDDVEDYDGVKVLELLEKLKNKRKDLFN